MKIDSPYIAKLYGLTTLIIGGKKTQGLVMEYVHGKSYFIDEVYRLSKIQVLEVCKQLVEAFRAFDKAGFCHNDLDTHFKNILIDKRGKIKIIDYEDTRKGSTERNQCDAIKQVLDVLRINKGGLFEKFLEKYPKLQAIPAKGRQRHKIMVKSSEPLPTFDELIKTLDELKTEG